LRVNVEVVTALGEGIALGKHLGALDVEDELFGHENLRVRQKDEQRASLTLTPLREN
jgi:hypothetical protein